jgi:hypothetical protein
LEMKILYTRRLKRAIIVGKHIDNRIVRELPFSKAVLWKIKSFSIPQELVDYAERNNVEDFVFADLAKKNYVQIGMDKVLSEGTKDNYGFGPHVYVPMDAGVELDSYKQAPFLSGPDQTIYLT